MKFNPTCDERLPGRCNSVGPASRLSLTFYLAAGGIQERFNKSESLDGKSVRSFREVLDCGSPLPLFYRSTGAPKRQRAAAVQDAGARFDGRSLFGGYGIFENALKDGDRRDAGPTRKASA
jgi:hypothetical protein